MILQENNIMLDLETMGLSNNAAITAIGAVKFDIHGVSDTFHMIIDMQSSVDAGMTIDPNTVMWWLQQSKEAQEPFSNNQSYEASSIKDALYAFADWANGLSYNVWGNGVMSDNVWLANAYDKTGINMPWHYTNDRCYRTVKAMHPHIEQDEFQGIEHNALDDARNQAMHLIKICKSYKYGEK